jgi:hypothetical protein
MLRRKFFQLLAGVAVTAAMKPWQGFGLGQTELTPAPILESYIPEGIKIIFPQATGNWGTITHVLLPGNPDIIVPIVNPKTVLPGDVPGLELTLHLELDNGSYARLYPGDSVALQRLLEDGTCEEVSGNGYQRATIHNVSPRDEEGEFHG